MSDEHARTHALGTAQPVLRVPHGFGVGVGAALGPLTAGLLIEAHSATVLAWTAAIHLSRGLRALDPLRRQPPVPDAEKPGFGPDGVEKAA